MTLGTAVAYAVDNPDRLPNTGGNYRCQSCGRTFHRDQETCPACDGTLTVTSRNVLA